MCASPMLQLCAKNAAWNNSYDEVSFNQKYSVHFYVYKQQIIGYPQNKLIKVPLKAINLGI